MNLKRATGDFIHKISSLFMGEGWGDNNYNCKKLIYKTLKTMMASELVF
jgi:hypothetical protein